MLKKLVMRIRVLKYYEEKLETKPGVWLSVRDELRRVIGYMSLIMLVVIGLVVYVVYLLD